MSIGIHVRCSITLPLGGDLACNPHGLETQLSTVVRVLEVKEVGRVMNDRMIAHAGIHAMRFKGATMDVLKR